ncbi:MAG: nickel pincer cofactor biosynthesis protein LarB [Elusimicrobia bacterium]|nr:nickel pincer cofactor biosynthesis protein LarB [Candidatus Liberimonas magnetica]
MKHSHYFPEPERYERQGFPEAVYAPGKTTAQIVSITKTLCGKNGPVLITRADKTVFSAVKKRFKKARYFAAAKLIVVKYPDKFHPNGLKKYICVVTAGTGDIPAAEEAALTAEVIGAKVERIYDVGVSGIHRLYKHKEKLLNASCVVVCAGMEGALASVVGGLVSCPVIGVPTSIGYGVSFKGVSAMLTMLNSCAPNVSVVNIDDGFGAGVIASLMCKE